jgi:Flp pilus assembly protein TadD
VPKASSNVLADCVLVFALCMAAAAQDSGTPSSQTSSSSSGAHKTTHHIKVEDEDSPAQPPELTQAEAAIEKQDYSTAESLLHKLVQKNETSYVGWFDLGYVENALGNVDASISAYRKAVAAKPDVFESNLNLGLQLAKSGQPEAQNYLRAATQLKPTSHVAEGRYRAWLSLGRSLEKAKPEDAIEAYQHAAELQPKEADPHLAAGVLFEQEHKAADAEREYKQVLAIEPASPEAAIALANLYMYGRRFPEAEDYLRKLAGERPDSAAVEIQLGRVLAAEGKNDDAIAALQSGIKLAPGDQAALVDLAEVYTTTGKNDLAESTCRALVAAYPNDADLHRRLGQALLRQKKFADAQQEFITTLKIKPDLGEAYGDLAFAASENENYALVLRALDARTKILPESSITYFLRASASDHLRDYKTAAANYRLFLKTAEGKYPDYEWKAKHRLIAIAPKK